MSRTPTTGRLDAVGRTADAVRRLRDWRLERLVDRFLSCADSAGAERLVATRPRLTGDGALALLASWEEARSDAGHTTADTYEYHRMLLERCRGEGPARVSGELTAVSQSVCITRVWWMAVVAVPVALGGGLEAGHPAGRRPRARGAGGVSRRGRGRS